MGPTVTANGSARMQASVVCLQHHAFLQSIQSAFHASAETASECSFTHQIFIKCLLQARPSLRYRGTTKIQ